MTLTAAQRRVLESAAKSNVPLSSEKLGIRNVHTLWNLLACQALYQPIENDASYLITPAGRDALKEKAQ